MIAWSLWLDRVRAAWHAVLSRDGRRLRFILHQAGSEHEARNTAWPLPFRPRSVAPRPLVAFLSLYASSRAIVCHSLEPDQWGGVLQLCAEPLMLFRQHRSHSAARDDAKISYFLFHRFYPSMALDWHSLWIPAIGFFLRLASASLAYAYKGRRRDRSHSTIHRCPCSCSCSCSSAPITFISTRTKAVNLPVRLALELKVHSCTFCFLALP